jgi:hypothetical protein
MAFYRELRYRAPSWSAHVEAWHRAEDLPEVSVLTQHANKLGFLERAVFFSDEHACRLVLEVSEQATAPGRSDANFVTDPYRRFEDFVTAVRPDIAALIEDLAAEHAEVTRAAFAFQTRDYEASVRDGFARELADAARERGLEVVTQIDSSADSEDHIPLFGRVHGEIPGVLYVAALVRRSGLVDPDEVRLRLA